MAFEVITQAPRLQKIALGVMLLALVAGGGYFLLLSPKMTEVEQLRGEKTALEGKVIQARAESRNLAGFEAKAKTLEARLSAAREQLPAEKEMPKLYRQVSELATKEGLAVSLFQPRPPQLKDYHAEVPIQIIAEGGYHQLGEFFEKLARLPRIVTLSDFRLQAINRPTGSMQADLNLITYLLRPEGEPPAPGAKPAPGDKR
ncbi:MAG: type 4a pilus biogenesis protein PilO [Candidatus Rokubacteria bacterium]|nr:type 4a pilus biogenesis protein PilO [Candidatus Rokubacteria bacterium]